MTVCIAALCADGGDPRAVVAADRMVTLGGFIEFEHSVPKMAAASPVAIVMVAGDALLGKEIANAVADSVAAGSSPSVAELAQALASQYKNVRNGQIEEQFLAPRGLDLNTFYSNHAGFNQQITMMVDQQMAGHNLGVELLLAGVDGDGAHLHTTTNPGADRLHDVIGYSAVGSGAIHALQSMIGFQHSASADYHKTVFRVYASKRRSEVAPGVGRDTDMAVVSGAGIHWLTAEELRQLKLMYEEFTASTDDALVAKLADFTLGEGGDNADEDTDAASADSHS